MFTLGFAASLAIIWVIHNYGTFQISVYDQIVLQHKEHVLFQNPHTGRWQMSRDLRNTYYHARLSCVATKHLDFSPGELQVGDVKDSLNLYALNVLRQEFGLLV